MKFGKRLLRQLHSAWSEFYINYKALKQELNRLKGDWSSSDCSWQHLLASELSKVNAFYLRTESLLVNELKEFEAVIHTSPSMSDELAVPFASLCKRLELLRNFVVLNYITVYKIVKKRNKIVRVLSSHDSTSSTPVPPVDFASLLLEQPFYTSQRLAKVTVMSELLSLQLATPGPTGTVPTINEANYLCPICLDVLCCPVVLSCAHRFCQPCIAKFAKNVRACPVCRKTHNTTSNFVVDGKLHQFLKEHFPERQNRWTVEELCDKPEIPVPNDATKVSYEDDPKHHLHMQAAPQTQQQLASFFLQESLHVPNFATVNPLPPIHHKGTFLSAAAFVTHILTAVLSLLPIYWLLLLLIVGYFSVVIALMSGVAIVAYPHLTWNNHFRKSASMEVAWLYHKLVSAIFYYFPITLTRTHILHPEQRYLFGYHPHGMYCFGLFSVSCPTVSGWDQLFPGVRCAMGVANSILCVPLLCNIIRALGFIPASRESMRSALHSGHNLIIVPGGIAEMFEGDRDCNEEAVVLKSRKGFIHFAITHGMHLVPVYGFGENKTFKRYQFGKSFRLGLSRRFKIALQLFSGKWGTLVPYNDPIHVVVGKPIEVQQNSNPSEQEVESLLAQYQAELRNLFEHHKHRVGYENRKLVIL